VSTPGGQDDRELVEAALHEPGAVGLLHDRHFLRGCRALEHLNQFEWRGTPFVAWLFRIASHVLADHWT
jgi:hypothetical protein